MKSKKFRMVDYGLIAMMILPILACIVLKVLFTPALRDKLKPCSARRSLALLSYRFDY